jgi:hypothetical protein
MRLFQAQRELPAFAGVQCRRRVFRVGISAQINMLRYADIRRERFFDIESHALPSFRYMRQFGNHAGHLDVSSLPLRWQTKVQALFTLPCGVIKPGNAGKGGDQHGAYHAKCRRSCWYQQHKRHACQQPAKGHGRQDSLLLQQPHA